MQSKGAFVRFALFAAFASVGLGFMALAGVTSAWAETPTAALLDDFTKDNFAATDKAIAALAVSGDARAAPVLEALKADHLFFTVDPKAVFIKDAEGHLSDAATGAAVATEPATLKPVRLNNRVRGALAVAFGTVMLASPTRAAAPMPRRASSNPAIPRRCRL